MEKTTKLLALLLSFIMLVSFIGCVLGLLGDDSISQIDKASVTSSNTSVQQISSDVSRETNCEIVWIPRTGSKFHKNASCGNMQYRSQTTKQEAERRGYEPCKNCYYKK